MIDPKFDPDLRIEPRHIVEWNRAVDLRNEKRRRLTSAQKVVAETKSRLRASQAAKELRQALGTQAYVGRELAQAEDSLLALEEEIRTGLTGLPLLDAVRINQVDVMPAAAARPPARPRKRQRAAAASQIGGAP
jgi:hypothetical protein